MISGVQTKPLKIIVDERGRLGEILRGDDDIFKQFGQVYFTTARVGVVKAWHYHEKQTDLITCISGEIKLVLFDGRLQSVSHGKIQEFFLGPDCRFLVRIPPNVFHGFKCIGDQEAIILNIPDRPYNHVEPDEKRADPHDNGIPYNWTRKDG